MPTNSKMPIKKSIKADKVEIVTNYKKHTDRHRFLRIGRHGEADRDFNGRETVGRNQQEAEDRRGLRRRPDHGGQERKRNVRFLGDGLHLHNRRSRRPTTIRRWRPSCCGSTALAGSATASDLIWRETVRIKKPIIASMATWPAAADTTSPWGQEDLRRPMHVDRLDRRDRRQARHSRAVRQLGLNTEVIARGANSGAMSSGQPFTDGERKVWIELLQDTYHQFVSKAAKAAR